MNLHPGMPAGPANLAQGGTTLTEFLVYMGILFALLIILILVKIFLGVYTARKLKNMGIPFGLTGEDLGRMKERGGLTEEEFKAVRAAMARKILEKTREEEEAKNLPPKADLLLTRAEQELRGMKQGEIREEAPPSKLPPHLEPFHGKDLHELEELFAAGFLTREDFILLRGLLEQEES